MKRYTIEVQCNDAEWWRYNVEMMCEELDASGARLGISTASSRIAEVGANLSEPPTGVTIARKIRLKTNPCHTARLLLYLLPHSLPKEPSVEENKAPKLSVKLYCGELLLRTERHSINPWGGLSLSIPISELK
ncbi:MAG: hypothetical protein IKZ12_04370 [Alistipes sp.]|nr:hypothetical protein [Alistipes sp.]